MLRRQQAAAIVAARAKIVEGAVLMVREAIDALEEGTDGSDPIRLDDERKATFASNLMTVIASDAPTAPVVNVGTLKPLRKVRKCKTEESNFLYVYPRISIKHWKSGLETNSGLLMRK